MPALTRHAPRLLSTVEGRPHATSDDHREELPAGPPSNSTSTLSTLRFPREGKKEEEDVEITADPLSSSDEESPPSIPAPSTTKTFLQPRRLAHPTEAPPPKRPSFRHAHGAGSPGSVNSSPGKRSSEDGSDTDAMVFSSQGSGAAKRRRTSAVQMGNVHARTSVGYGRERRRKEERGKTGFRKREVRGGSAEEEKEKPRGFVRPKVKGGFVSEEEEEGRAKFRSIRGGGSGVESSPLSCTASPPRSSGVEVQEEDSAYTLTVECTMCGQQIDRFLKEDFEDKFTPGRQLSYKWQQRFCTYHKQQDGKIIWEERGYPEIDWDHLEQRFRRHKSRLLAVVDGKTKSFYRDRLSERLKERLNTTIEVLSAENVKRVAVVGYYGPRGERMMTDHIVSHLSHHLRRSGAKDKLVAAAGISGGVSGFVQAVLVPELAQLLVMEDMDVSAEGARAIVAESAELGDLVNPEAEEKVPVVDLEE